MLPQPILETERLRAGRASVCSLHFKYSGPPFDIITEVNSCFSINCRHRIIV